MSTGQGIAPLLLRADFGSEVGSGHVMRCLALAQAWVARGGPAALLAAALPDHVRARAVAAGVEVLDPSAATDLDAGWVVLDGYHFGRADQEAVLAGGKKLLVVDDHGRVGHYDADLVVDQNLGAAREWYAHRAPRTRLLLGPRYALLRAEFARLVPDRSHERPVRRVLVTLGGCPAPEIVDRVAAALRVPHLADLDVTVAGGADDLAVLMVDADLAVAAAGTTSWELCCMGVPTVLVSVADNQVPVARALAEAGVALDAGPVDEGVGDRVAQGLRSLRGDPAKRAVMVTRGRVLVDGRGADRVVTEMLTGGVRVRAARAEDCGTVWEWNNDPVTRAFSFSSDPIPWADHVAWFEARVAGPAEAVLVAEDAEGRPVGVARFGRDGVVAEIGVTVAPERRGNGLGAAIIREATARLLDATDVQTVEAWIKPENGASIQAFRAAGFVFRGKDVHRSGQPAVRYVLERRSA